MGDTLLADLRRRVNHMEEKLNDTREILLAHVAACEEMNRTVISQQQDFGRQMLDLRKLVTALLVVVLIFGAVGLPPEIWQLVMKWTHVG